MHRQTTYDFTCLDCGESFVVNSPVRATLIEDGCVVCGNRVAVEAFSIH